MLVSYLKSSRFPFSYSRTWGQIFEPFKTTAKQETERFTVIWQSTGGLRKTEGRRVKEALTRPASQVSPRCGRGGCLRVPCAAGCPSSGSRCGGRWWRDWAQRCWGRWQRQERWGRRGTSRRPASSGSDRATHSAPNCTKQKHQIVFFLLVKQSPQVSSLIRYTNYFYLSGYRQ